MRKAALLLAATLLAAFLSPALADDAALPRVEFYITHYVGHTGRETKVIVQCRNPGAVTPGGTFELRNQHGTVLAVAQWRNPRSRLTFTIRADETMLGGHDLSVWQNGVKVSTGDAYAAISDLSVPRVTRLSPAEPAISLTIVCGGGTSRQMDKILSVLEKHGVKATFFINGGYLTAHPEDARRIVAAGHEVGSHGYQHIHMTQSDNYRQLRGCITAMTRAMQEQLGVTPRLFRAPYSETNQKVTALCRAEGQEDVLWSTDSRDWSDAYKRRPQAIIDRVTGKAAVSGAVIQFHLNGYHTAEVLDAVIPRYQQEYGLKVVTVGELLALSGRELPPLPQE